MTNTNKYNKTYPVGTFKNNYLQLKSICSVFILLLTISYQSVAQKAVDPFQIYGPFGSITYKSYYAAIKNYKEAFKLQSHNEDWTKGIKKFDRLSNLYVFDISTNNIDTLPESMGTMKDLMYFKTSGNPFRTLPNSIGGCYSLRTIKLHFCAIDSLPKSFNQLRNLRELEIQANQADTLHFQNALKNLTALNQLFIYKSNLKAVPNYFNTCPKLASVAIIDCGIQDLDSNFTLPKSCNTLILDNNPFNQFPKKITEFTSLRVVSLKNCGITALPEWISKLTGLEVLDITGNSIDLYQIDVLKILLPQCKIIYTSTTPITE